MMWLLLASVFIWAVAAQSRASKLSASLKQVLETYDKAKKDSDRDKYKLSIQSFNVNLLLKHLIRVHGPKKAVQIYIANLEDAPHATDALEALYEVYGVPKQYASQLSMIAYNAQNKREWDQNDIDDKRAKYKKTLLRNMVTDFENIEDDMKSTRD